MDDRRLEEALRAIVGRRHAPAAALVRRTKARLRGRRLILVVSVLSLATQLGFFAIVINALLSPDAETGARIAGFASLFAYVGCVVVALVAARERVTWFFRRVERLTT
jgi:predicted PurR-regulated permease PerM